jgi:hypothetical protein
LVGLVILASALALANPLQAAETVRMHLTEAAIATRDVEHCSAKSLRWQPRFDTLSVRTLEVTGRAQGFLGSGIEPAMEVLMAAEPSAAPLCSDEFVDAAVSKAEAALIKVERVSEQLEAATNRGVWLGLFPLCGARSARVVVSPYTGEPVAEIELGTEQAKELAAYIGMFSPGSGVVAHMSLRLNGEFVSRPGVYDASLTTKLTLSGQSAPYTEAIVVDARAACGVS